MSGLAADGATTRLHRLFRLIEFCAGFGVQGCTTRNLMKEGQLAGNTAPRVLEYITLLINWKLIRRIADRYYVDELNYIEWLEAQGYRERTYVIKCSKPECPTSYGSKMALCPTCKTPNPYFLNEHQNPTHTRGQEMFEFRKGYLDKKTTEPHTYIHTNTPRPRRVQEGKKAELRVVELLNRHGEATLGVGQGGRPDVHYVSKNGGKKYGVEVKSVAHQVQVAGDRYKVASVPLSRGQWIGLCEYMGSCGADPLLIVEVRVRGSNKGPIYHVLTRDVVDFILDRTEAANIRISVQDLAALSLQTYRIGLPIPGGWLL